jgi:hypothetical protein
VTPSHGRAAALVIGEAGAGSISLSERAAPSQVRRELPLSRISRAFGAVVIGSRTQVARCRLPAPLPDAAQKPRRRLVNASRGWVSLATRHREDDFVAAASARLAGPGEGRPRWLNPVFEHILITLIFIGSPISDWEWRGSRGTAGRRLPVDGRSASGGFRSGSRA